MDRATLEYPVKPGLLFCLDRAFPYRAQRDPRREGDRVARPGRGRDRHRRPGVIDLPGRRLPAPLPPGPPVRPRADGPHRRIGPGRRGRPGDRAAGARSHRPRGQGRLRPAGDGHAGRSRDRPRDLPDVQPQHPRRVELGRVPLDLRPVPPQRRPLHDQHRRAGDAQDVHPRRAGHARPARDPVPDHQLQVAETSLAASFVPNVSDVPAPLREPAPRVVVEREEA